MANDLTLFLNALEIERVVLVGHSMGSFVAQRFAIDQPARTAGLALLGSATGFRGNAVIEDFWPARSPRSPIRLIRRLPVSFN
jgi:pimeloyl-ACP methyl ester carboxylesterase